MSAHSGPNIDDTGLVFSYDAYNTDKSWKGPPTTNLADVSLNGWGITLTYIGLDKGWKKYAMSGTFSNGTYPFIMNITAISFTGGTTYSTSCYIKTNVLSKFNYFGTGMSYVNEPMTKGGTSFSIPQTDGSFYIGVSNFAYTATTAQPGFVQSNPINNTTFNAATDFVWIKDGQIELGEFPTPFVSGTRFANSNLESTPNFPTWNQASGTTASAGTLTFTSGSYNSKGNWDLYKTYSGLSTGTNYTWSALVKLGTASNLILTMNNTQAWNTGPANVFTDLSSTSWKRVSIIGTTSSGSFNLHLGATANTALINTVQSGGTILIKDVKLELTGAKSALIDLTGNNTINTNSLTYSADGTFSFNGSSNYISISDSLSLQVADTFSISAWINPTILNSRFGVFSTRTANDTGSWQLEVGAGSNGQNRVAVTGIGTWIFESSNDVISTGQWCNVCFVKPNNATQGGTMYVNGVPITPAATAAYTILNNTNNKTIGVGTSLLQNFPGKIGNIQLYNRALTAAEVLQHYNALAGRFNRLYQTMAYTATSNVTLTNNGTQEVTMFKNADNNSWNGEVRSTEIFTAPCTIEFSKQAGTTDNNLSYAMIGWNEDPITDSSYSSIDHASYPYITSAYSVYNNGSQVHYGGAWDVNKRFYIVYDADGYIRHYNGSTLLYSANYGTNKVVSVDSSFYSVNSTFGGFTNVKVMKSSWNGTNYV